MNNYLTISFIIFVIIEFVIWILGGKNLRDLAKEYNTTVLYLLEMVKNTDDKSMLDKYKKAKKKAIRYGRLQSVILVIWFCSNLFNIFYINVIKNN